MLPRDELGALVRAHGAFRAASEVMERAGIRSDGLVVAAVSGGGDSTALAILVAAWAEKAGRPLLLAYFDHDVDPRRHAEEWQRVGALAHCLGVPAAKGESRMFAHLRGRSLEETWRLRRYAFLSMLAGRAGCIVTGHTMDDAAETFLLAAVRGGSGDAMAGPRAQRDRIVRPLLRVRREDLRALLRDAQADWVEDPGNTGTGPRSFVRAHIVPALTERFGPEVVAGLARSAAHMEEWSEALETCAEEALTRAVRAESLHVFLDLRALRSYPRAVRRRVLRRVLASRSSPDASLSAAAEELISLCDGSSGRRQLPSGIEAVRSGSVLRIGPSRSPAQAYRRDMPVPGCVTIAAWRVTSSSVWAAGQAPKLPASKLRAMFDRDRLREPLHLRNRRQGDRFVPFGMTSGVKLKKYLRDHGVPSWERWSRPLLCDADGRILWIPGIARCNHGVVGSGTRRILIVEGMRMGMHEEAYGA